MYFLYYVMLISFFFFEQPFAHSGGTDEDGCHQNSKTGERHCHNKKEEPTDPPENEVLDMPVSDPMLSSLRVAEENSCAVYDRRRIIRIGGHRGWSRRL